jgi:hypothetical protein
MTSQEAAWEGCVTMATVHDRFRATAVRLIRKFGSDRKATFYRFTHAVSLPSGEGAITSAEHSIWCVTPPVGQSIRTPFGEAASEEHAIRVVVPALGLAIVPRPGDQVSVPGRAERFGVQDCKAIQPDGDAIAFVVSADRVGS